MTFHKTVHQHVQVPLHYPVVFTRRAFDSSNNALAELLHGSSDQPRKVLALIDDGVSLAFPKLADELKAWFAQRSDTLDLVRDPVALPGGEAVKNDYRQVMNLVDLMLEYHLCRHSVVLVIGGGAVLDAAGFATALVHRGLRLVRMPSTTLAQNDAGIGVKNGMNLHGGKNTIGVFAAPYAVLNDFALLDGLSDTDWRAGIAEAFKVAMIKDRVFYQELLDMAPALGRRDRAAMERLVIRCAELHLDHIATGGDPFELGSARPLDFGHWSAHKLEALSNYRIGHGQAVAIGLVIDSHYAAHLGWISHQDANTLANALQTCGFAPDVPELHITLGDNRPAILQGLDEFREHLGGRLTLSLPRPIGQKAEIHEVDESVMAQILREKLRWDGVVI
jgi:3-dehydroquinate synthase